MAGAGASPFYFTFALLLLLSFVFSFMRGEETRRWTHLQVDPLDSQRNLTACVVLRLVFLFQRATTTMKACLALALLALAHHFPALGDHDRIELLAVHIDIDIDII